MGKKECQDCMIYNYYYEWCECIKKHVLPNDERAETCKEFE